MMGNKTDNSNLPIEKGEQLDGNEDEVKDDRYSINRRSTLGLLAALSSAGLFASSGAAQAGQEGDVDDAVSVSADQPVGTETLLQLIVAEYGELLTNEQISQLEDDVASNREAAQELRAFDLANGDDMAVTFRAYRGSY
jgi:hypothetical protein